MRSGLQKVGRSKCLSFFLFLIVGGGCITPTQMRQAITIERETREAMLLNEGLERTAQIDEKVLQFHYWLERNRKLLRWPRRKQLVQLDPDTMKPLVKPEPTSEEIRKKLSSPGWKTVWDEPEHKS